MLLRGFEGIMKEKLELNEQEWKQAMKRYGPIRSRAAKVNEEIIKINDEVELAASSNSAKNKQKMMRRSSTLLNKNTAALIQN